MVFFPKLKITLSGGQVKSLPLSNSVAVDLLNARMWHHRFSDAITADKENIIFIISPFCEGCIPKFPIFSFWAERPYSEIMVNDKNDIEFVVIFKRNYLIVSIIFFLHLFFSYVLSHLIINKPNTQGGIIWGIGQFFF